MRVEHLGAHARQSWMRLRGLYVEEVQIATGRGRRAAMLMGKKATELLGTAAGEDAPAIAAAAWRHALRAQVLADCMAVASRKPFARSRLLLGRD